MTKLAMSVAILALEEKGYEQANNKPYSFLRKVGAVTIICRLQSGEVITGAYTASLDYQGETTQVKHSFPVLMALDIESAEARLTYELVTTIKNRREDFRVTREAQERLLEDTATTLRTALALACVAFDTVTGGDGKKNKNR